jgi:hypothetical protein
MASSVHGFNKNPPGVPAGSGGLDALTVSIHPMSRGMTQTPAPVSFVTEMK